MSATFAITDYCLRCQSDEFTRASYYAAAIAGDAVHERHYYARQKASLLLLADMKTLRYASPPAAYITLDDT